MPLLYGEGNESFRRLQQNIFEQTGDETVFAFTDKPAGKVASLFAASADQFAGSDLKEGNIGPMFPWRSKPPKITAWGFEIFSNATKLTFDYGYGSERTSGKTVYYVVRLACGWFKKCPPERREEELPVTACYLALRRYEKVRSGQYRCYRVPLKSFMEVIEERTATEPKKIGRRGTKSCPKVKEQITLTERDRAKRMGAKCHPHIYSSQVEGAKFYILASPI